MVEEFHESDVVWPDNNLQCPSPAATAAAAAAAAAGAGAEAYQKKKKKKKASSPIDIPRGRSRTGFHDENEGFEDEEMAPPHILLARRYSRRLVCSMCAGNGRTLKGRDLRYFRNSILRMTGFLEGKY